MRYTNQGSTWFFWRITKHCAETSEHRTVPGHVDESRFSAILITHYENLSFERVPRIVTHISAPALPLSRSCQTPKDINPNTVITTAVVFHNSISKTPLSWSCPVMHGPQTPGAYICREGEGWLIGLTTRIYRSGKTNHSSEMGYQLPKREISVMNTEYDF